jgi:hypothetical protein
MESNCGTLPLQFDIKTESEQFQNQLYLPGKADYTKKTIPYFHQKICEWAYNIPLKFNWVLVIDFNGNKNYILQEIASLKNKYEDSRWNVTTTAKETTIEDVQDTIGCIFAQGVVIPGEDVALEYAGITEGSKRGFINAPIINGRANFQPLEVGFLDTNRSFVDGFLRPWSILVAHKGLIASWNPSNNIKSTITVYQLARAGTDQRSKIRKSFTFTDCAPINISGETLDYSGGTDFPKLQAKFVYNKYFVNDFERDDLYIPRPDDPLVYSANSGQLNT